MVCREGKFGAAEAGDTLEDVESAAIDEPAMSYTYDEAGSPSAGGVVETDVCHRIGGSSYMDTPRRSEGSSGVASSSLSLLLSLLSDSELLDELVEPTPSLLSSFDSVCLGFFLLLLAAAAVLSFG